VFLEELLLPLLSGRKMVEAGLDSEPLEEALLDPALAFATGCLSTTDAFQFDAQLS